MTQDSDAARSDPARSYTYLLGMYLGDGCILKARNSHRLQIYLNKDHPQIIRDCVESIACVLPRHRVGVVDRGQSIALSSYFRG